MSPFEFQSYDRSRDTAATVALMQAGPAARAAAAVAAGGYGARAAEIRGQTLADLAKNIGSDVQGGIQDYLKFKADEPRRVLQGQQITQNAMEIAAQQRLTQYPAVLAQAIAKNTSIDPQTGKKTVDHQGVASDISSGGFPDLSEKYLKTATDNATNLDKLDELQTTHVNKQLQIVADLVGDAKTPEAFQSGLGLLAAHAGHGIDQDLATQILTDAHAAGPDGWQTVATKYKQLSPSYKQEQTALETEMNKPRDLPAGSQFTTGTRAAAGQAPLAVVPPRPLAPTRASLSIMASSSDPDVAKAGQDALDKFDAGNTPPMNSLAEFTKRKYGPNPTPAQELAAKNEYDTSGRNTDATRAATITQRATAERWKASALAKLEAEYAATQPMGTDPTGQPRLRRGGPLNAEITPMSADQLNARKAQIQKSYLAEIGVTPEMSARALITAIQTKEAAGQDATAERAQLAALRNARKP